jgi:hypothetical protein
MSNIESNNINETYPVVGINNSTQGFRDNFQAIKTALTIAKNEITILENTAVLTAALDSTLPAVNDLNESVLHNGKFYDFYSKCDSSLDATGLTEITVDVRTGTAHQVTITGPTTIKFSNWPADGLYATTRLHVISDAPHAITFATANSGLVYLNTTITVPVLTSTMINVYDVWSYTNGSAVYVTAIGEF